MNYYIDFDNTLYETAKLTSTILNEISNLIGQMINEDKEMILNKIKSNFKSSSEDVFAFIEKVAQEYNVDKKILLDKVKSILSSGELFVYEDSIVFLEKLKRLGNKICLFTFFPNCNQEYQLQKINGSGLARFFDTMIFTSNSKHLLDLNYQNGVFIDDNTEVLEGLSLKNPLRLIRIRRKNNKYSLVDAEIENMEEYQSFEEVPIDFSE